MGGAYVVSERSAVSSVVSMVMLAVLRLMVNVYCKGKCNTRKEVITQMNIRRTLLTSNDEPRVRAFLTLVSLFIGFPKSHSTWEPLVFAWHLICNQSRDFFLFVCFFQTNLIAQSCFKVSAIPLKKSKPVVGFSSLRRRERAGARSQAEQHEHRLHPQKGSGGQRAYWPRWPPAPPVAGPTETTPAHHLHLWRGKDLGTAVLNLWVVDLEWAVRFLSLHSCLTEMCECDF